MLEVAKLPDRTSVADVIDALVGQQDGMTDCVVLYEKHGEIGWLTTEFEKWSEFLGFIELCKLHIHHESQHQEEV